MKISELKISTRIQFLVVVSLISMITIVIHDTFELRQAQIEDRMTMTKNLVQTSLGIIQYNHNLYKTGVLTEDAAKENTKNTLKGLRYGTASDYFFIYDKNSFAVMVPPKPEWEGQDKSGLKDANGVFLIQELVKTAIAGGGFVNYAFPKAGKDKPEPKVSYALYFEPWGWMVGTGIYLSDVEEQFKIRLIDSLEIVIGVLFIIAGIGWYVTKTIKTSLGGEPADAAMIMRRVAAGDLTVNITAVKGSLLFDLVSMIQSLKELIAAITLSSEALVTEATQLSSIATKINAASEKQVDATSAMASAVEELSVSSTHISDRAKTTKAESISTISLAKEGTLRVTDATSAIREVASSVEGATSSIHVLKDSATQIASIANVIKEIASQTNLLALNAAIEAARAGDTGRGFAVVADEVRKLAERTSAATKEIEGMVDKIQVDTSLSVNSMEAVLPKVENVVAAAQTATESLKNIANGANRSLESIAEVANATHEQSLASTEISSQVENVARMVDETLQIVRGTTDAASSLKQLSVMLQTQISHFKIN